MSQTRQLARFCHGLKYGGMPPEVIEKAKLCILDFVANIYGSLELDAAKAVAEYVKTIDAKGKATVLGCGYASNAHHAAFVNGTLAEAIEAQDGLRFGGNHPGTAVIPAALAIAEETGAGGKAVIEAVVAGYEAADRAAAAVHPWSTLSGFLPTGTCGTFGAAVAAARLLGCDLEQMLSAMGGAGYMAPISMAENLMGGFTVKIVQGGQAAQAGIMAAGLAKRGISGMPYVLEGSALDGGFCKMTSSGGHSLEHIITGLGEHYSIMDIYFKPFTACRHTHGAAQASLELVRDEGLDPARIESVSVKTYGIAELAVGKGVDQSSTFVSAQFSIPYVVAVCLLDGKLGPDQLTERRVADADVQALAAKVSVQTDEQLNAVYPEKTSSRVEVALSGGGVLTRQVDTPLGDPRAALRAPELGDKVRAFAGARDLGRINEMIDMVLALENVSDISLLTKAV